MVMITDTAPPVSTTAEDLMHLTLPELGVRVAARLRADRLPQDRAILDAMEAEVGDDDEGGALLRVLDRLPRISPEQLQRLGEQSEVEGERQRAWGGWLLRFGDALHDRQRTARNVPIDVATARQLARELAGLIDSWPSGPRLRVAS